MNRQLKFPIGIIFFIASLLPTVAIGGSEIKHKQVKKLTKQLTIHDHVSTPSRDKEILIPANGQCLYKSIIVDYLLPVVNDPVLFQYRLTMLVGEDKVVSTSATKDDKDDECKDDSKVNEADNYWDAGLLQYIFLHLHRADLLYNLRQEYPFGLLVRDMKEHMNIPQNLWGGPNEIEKIAHCLQATIKEYTPNPDNDHNLVGPTCTSPKNKESSITLSVVQDKATKKETEFLEDDSRHRQHYRALLDVIPPFLTNKKSHLTHPLSLSHSSTRPIQSPQINLFNCFDKEVKDSTKVEYIEEQRKAVSFANIIQAGIKKSDRPQVFKGLQLLQRIKTTHVTNPKKVMEILLNVLTSEDIAWEVYGVKRHIAKAMRPFVFSMYLIAQKENKQLDTEHKKKLLKKIEKAIDLIDEHKNLGNGLRFELDVVQAMLKALPDTTSNIDQWKDSVMTTIEAIKEKDPQKLFQVLQKLYNQVKEKHAKKWYEVVLYINYLKEQATEDLHALSQLQSLLYWYKQRRAQKTKALSQKEVNNATKFKQNLKKGVAKINPIKPGGDWHILYAGIEALTYTVDHAAGGDTVTSHQIVQKALESTAKKQPGLAYYFDFNKLNKMGFKFNNWRIREKALESALLLKNHANQLVQIQVQQFLNQHKQNEKEDKRVKLLFTKANSIISIEHALQKKDYTQYKTGIRKMLDGQTETITKTIKQTSQKQEKVLERFKEEHQKAVEQKLNKNQEVIEAKLNKNGKELLKLEKDIHTLSQIYNNKQENLIDPKSLADINLQDDLDTIFLKVQHHNPMLLLVILTDQPLRDKDFPYQPEKKVTKRSFMSKWQKPRYKKYMLNTEGRLHHKAHKITEQLDCNIAQTEPSHIIVALLQWLEKSPSEQYIYDLAITAPICPQCAYLLTTIVGHTANIQVDAKGCQEAAFTWSMPSFAMRYLNRFILNFRQPLQITQMIFDKLLGISPANYQTLQQQHVSTSQALKHNQELVETLKRQLNQKDKKLNNTQKDFDNLQDELSQKIKETEEQMQQLNDQLNSNNVILKKTQQKLNNKQIECNNWQEELKQKMKETEKQMQQLNDQLSNKSNELKEFQNSNQDLKSKLDNKNSELSNLQDELNKKMKEAEEQMEQLKDQLNSNNVILKKTQQKLNNKQIECNNWQEELKQKMKETEKQMQQLNDQLSNKSNELKEFQNDNQDLKSKLDNKNSELSNLQEEFKQKLKETEEQMEQLKDQLSSNNVILKNTQNELNNKNKTLKNTQDRLDSKSNELNETQLKLANKENLLNETQLKLTNKENLLDESRNSEQELRDSLNTTERELTNKNNLISDKDNQISLLKEELQKQVQMNIKLKRKNTQVNKELKEAHNNLTYFKTPYLKCLTTLKGHEGIVLEVAFSPDGKRLASASHDKTVRIYDALSYQLLTTIKDDYEINSIAFSHNSERLAYASKTVIRIYNALTYKCLTTIKHFNARNVAFSHDGKRLAYCAKICNALTYKCLAEINIYNPLSIAFSHDDKRLAYADGDVRIYDALTYKRLTTIKHFNVRSVAFSHDGKRLASAGWDRTVRIYDALNYQLLTTLKEDEPIFSIAFSPHSKRLASAGADKTVRIYDALSYQLLTTLKGHKDVVRSVAFSPNGNQLASVSYDRTVRIWG